MQPQITRRANACSYCLAAFEPGQRFYSLVTEDEKEDWTRSDFCQNCWTAQIDRVKEKNIPFWTANIPLKQAKIDKRNLSKKEKALELLKLALEKIDDPFSKQEAFVLALFLAHGRYLALRKEVQQDGNAFQIFEDTVVNETYCVPLCDLSSVSIQEMQKTIAMKMQNAEVQS